MSERFDKLETQVGKLLDDVVRLRHENVSLRAENAKIEHDLQDRLTRMETMETTSARFLKLKNEHARYKKERADIRRETRTLLRKVRAIKKGDVHT